MISKVSVVLEKYEYSVVEPGTGTYADYLALRYAVFCEELGRIAPDGRSMRGVAIESDDYDVHSLHVLCRVRDSGIAVACSRLILPGPKGLNVNARYKLYGVPGVSVGQVGEIGRLALASSLRRYRTEAWSIGRRRRALGAESDPRHPTRKREGPVVALGLYREIINLASCYGITHCYAAMEPALARLLNQLGFPFHQAGLPDTSVSPARQPYLIGAQAAKAGLAARNSCLYRFMFGAAEAESHIRCSPVVWPAAAEPKTYRDAGAHV